MWQQRNLSGLCRKAGSAQKRGGCIRQPGEKSRHISRDHSVQGKGRDAFRGFGFCHQILHRRFRPNASIDVQDNLRLNDKNIKSGHQQSEIDVNCCSKKIMKCR
jgi:hypothetical protein